MVMKRIASAVQVEKDGIKLGWNVLAILASLGLGLYVPGIIGPIKDDLKDEKSERQKLEGKFSALQSAFHEEVKGTIKIHEGHNLRLQSLERRCSNNERNIEKMQDDETSEKG